MEMAKRAKNRRNININNLIVFTFGAVQGVQGMSSRIFESNNQLRNANGRDVVGERLFL